MIDSRSAVLIIKKYGRFGTEEFVCFQIRPIGVVYIGVNSAESRPGSATRIPLGKVLEALVVISLG